MLQVFAVEDDSVQLTWKGLPSRPATVGVGPSSVEVDPGPPAWLHRRGRSAKRLCAEPAGPGAAVVAGLDAATTYDVWLESGGTRRTVGSVKTATPPPGELLCRFATVSDLHVGESHFGVTGSIIDVQPRSSGLGPYPERAAAAALDEASAWGAELIVVKGDLTYRSRVDELRTVARLLAATGLPTLVQLGNHDQRASVSPAALLPGAAVAFGTGDPVVHDLPGARLILGHSARRRAREGHLDDAQVERIGAAAASAPGPAVVSLHHPPEPHRWHTYYPPGLVWPDTRKLVDALVAANPATLWIAGHSHRNRTYRVGGLLVAEVGSTKDYPGCWAGYAVHEGGIRQVVRRTARPDVIAWTEATASAIGGLWGRWSPGRLDDRCWSYPWPTS